jgi:hypothetical protein
MLTSTVLVLGCLPGRERADVPVFAGALSEATRRHDLVIQYNGTIPAQAGCLFEAGDSVTGAFIGVVRSDCDDSKCSSAGGDCIFGPDDAKSCGPGKCHRTIHQIATTRDTMRLVDCRADNCCRVEVLNEGVWGTVCDDLLAADGNAAAAVVCAQVLCSLPVFLCSPPFSLIRKIWRTTTYSFSMSKPRMLEMHQNFFCMNTYYMCSRKSTHIWCILLDAPLCSHTIKSVSKLRS